MLDHASRLLDGLNPAQQEAVTTTEGPVLVVAGPGSGKTRVLTHRIAYLIEERNVSPDQILAVTFTNKAAREMRDRVDRLLTGGSASGLVMGTFHALGVRILRQNPGLVADRLGLLPNFLIYDDGDQVELAKRSIVEIGLDPKQLAPRRMLSRISAAKSMLLTPDEVANEAVTYDDELVVRVYGEYERALRRANAVDFDDLLGLPIRLFDEVPALLETYQQRFRYILVDEYQDTNRVQYVLVTALAAHYRNLFVVGDPDQSIYAWRQADIRNILDFEKDYPDARQIHLELNYRSTGRIVQAADRVIRDNIQRIDRRIRTENVEGELIAVRELADQNHEASFVVGEIRRLMASQGLRGSDIAVMYRTTAQSRVLEEAFRNSDIPYRIVGGVRFYERKEVKDILAVLRLLHNPSDRIALERVLDNLPLGRGFGPKALETVVEWAAQHHEPVLNAFVALAPSATAPPDGSRPRLSGPGKAPAERVGSVFAKLIERERSSTLTELFDSVVELTGYRDTFNEANEEELQRWANVQELRSDLERYDLVEPGKALASYLEQVALVSDVDSMDEDAAGQVTLITLHSAKGLEFPVVFITGVEEGLLPISRAVEAEERDNGAAVEEERRLFYVGVTRAQSLLYLTYAGSRFSYGRFTNGSPSRFLESLPADTVRSNTRPTSVRTRAGRESRYTGGSLASRVLGNRTYDLPVAPREPAPIPTIRRYEVGQRVFHAHFGEGRVVEAREGRGDQELVVEFVRKGRKVLATSLVQMDVIGSDDQ